MNHLLIIYRSEPYGFGISGRRETVEKVLPLGKPLTTEQLVELQSAASKKGRRVRIYTEPFYHTDALRVISDLDK